MMTILSGNSARTKYTQDSHFEYYRKKKSSGYNDKTSTYPSTNTEQGEQKMMAHPHINMRGK